MHLTQEEVLLRAPHSGRATHRLLSLLRDKATFYLEIETTVTLLRDRKNSFTSIMPFKLPYRVQGTDPF